MSATEHLHHAAARRVDELYREHVGEVYRYAYAVLGSHADAEDVTQATFMNALRALERGEQPQRPGHWLIVIAHNLVRQRWRQAARRPVEVELALEIPAVDSTDDGLPLEDLVRALQRIPPAQREALVMRELEGRSYTEIAELVGLSVGALETLLFRARRSLADELENLLTCDRAELALNRRADGTISRKDRRRLQEHLAECNACARLAETHAKSRRAFRGLAMLPLPVGLTLFYGNAPAAASVGLTVLEGGAGGSAATGGAATTAGTTAASVSGGGAAAGVGTAATAAGGSAGAGLLAGAAAKVAAVLIASVVGVGGITAYERQKGDETPTAAPSELAVDASGVASLTTRGAAGVDAGAGSESRLPHGSSVAGGRPELAAGSQDTGSPMTDAASAAAGSAVETSAGSAPNPGNTGAGSGDKGSGNTGVGDKGPGESPSGGTSAGTGDSGPTSGGPGTGTTETPPTAGTGTSATPAPSATTTKKPKKRKKPLPPTAGPKPKDKPAKGPAEQANPAAAGAQADKGDKQDNVDKQDNKQENGGAQSSSQSSGGSSAETSDAPDGGSGAAAEPTAPKDGGSKGSAKHGAS